MGLFDFFKKRPKTKDQPALVRKPGREKLAVKPAKEVVRKPEVKKELAGQAKAKKIGGQAFRVLIKPEVTEKSANVSSLNQYIFAVAGEANKVMVKKAIEEIYGVRPVRVNIINVSGKGVRYGRISGRTKDWKKAVVTLRAGEKIKVYEGV